MKVNKTLGTKVFSMGCLALAIHSATAGAAVIEEVVVTATKRAENIQDVPISISAFGEGFIADSGVTDLQELSAYAPNLSLNKSGQVTNTRIAIRGVGSVGNSAIEPSVAVFIDGVYYPRPGSVVGKLQDIEAVEVLRGPQGTLFGRNASMGALNIRTKKPDQEPSTDISVTAGNFDHYSGNVTINGGLTDTIAGRLSVQHSDQGGWGKSTFDDEEIGEFEDTSVRGALTFDISDETSATLRADWKSIENNGTVIEVVPDSVRPQYLGVIGFVLDPTFSDGIGNGPLPEVKDGFDGKVHQKQNDSAEDDQWGVSLDIEGAFANHTWRSITSYREWDNTTFEDLIRLPADLIPRDNQYAADTYSQEFQLLSDTDSAFQYVAGMYYYHEEYTLDQDLNLGADFCRPAVHNFVFNKVPVNKAATANLAANFCSAGPQLGAVVAEFEQEVDSLAIFAQGTYDFSEVLSGTLGLRWTEDKKDGSFSQVVNNPVAGVTHPFALGLRVNEQSNMKFDDSMVTWMANLRYTPNEDLMAFLTVSTGYKAGGFNSDGAAVVLGDQRVFDSEEVMNYELGIKSTLMDSMTLNATIFRTDIDQFQDRLFNGLSFVVVNAGELRQQGIEIDVNAKPTENLSLTAGLSYLDSEFLDYSNGTNLPGFDASESQDLKGTRNNFSPKYQASLAAEWRDELSDNLEWFIRGEYQYVDDQNINGQTDNNPAQIQDGYGVINLRVGLADAAGAWDLTFYGRNINDEGYCQASFYQPLASNLGLQDSVTGNAMTRCVLAEPRTYGVTLNYHM
jgi:iron complex outermembrane receptor protein